MEIMTGLERAFSLGYCTLVNCITASVMFQEICSLYTTRHPETNYKKGVRSNSESDTDPDSESEQTRKAKKNAPLYEVHILY